MEANNLRAPEISAVAVSLRNIAKSFGGVRALKGVDVDFTASRVHALLGPNGSGKSTLMAVLGGAVVPDAGTIAMNGVPVGTLSPALARDQGIAVIYQHFSLAGSLSVSDNIFLGAELRQAGIFIDKAEQRRRSKGLLEEFGIDLDPDTLVETLAPGEQQLVEIAKALLHSPKVLVLDEPTTALSVREVEELLRRVRQLADLGLAIVFISHILNDVLAVADDITILRDGVVTQRGTAAEFDKASLIEAIAPGHKVASRAIATQGKPLLTFDNAVVNGTGPWNLTVHEGEILGLFGLLGSGTSEFLEGLFGAGTGANLAGGITWQGKAYRAGSPAEAIRQGVSLVASDRIRKGLFASMSALDNVMLPFVGAKRRLGLLRDTRAERTAFDKIADGVRLKPRTAWLEGINFSGGNQQKLILGRWLNELSSTRLLLLDEPTQGVDVGARGEIYALIREFARVEGCAVIVAASEVEELSELSDRAVVLGRKKVLGIIERSAAFEDNVLHLAHQSH